MVLDLCWYTHLLHPISELLHVQRRGFRGTVTVPSMCAWIALPFSEVALRLPRRLGVTAMPAQSFSEGKPYVRHCRCMRDVEVPHLP